MQRATWVPGGLALLLAVVLYFGNPDSLPGLSTGQLALGTIFFTGLGIIMTAWTALTAVRGQLGIAEKTREQERIRSRHDEMTAVYNDALGRLAHLQAWIMTDIGSGKRDTPETYDDVLVYLRDDWHVGSRLKLHRATAEAEDAWNTATRLSIPYINLEHPSTSKAAYDAAIGIAAKLEISVTSFAVAAAKHLREIWPEGPEAVEGVQAAGDDPTEQECAARLRESYPYKDMPVVSKQPAKQSGLLGLVRRLRTSLSRNS